MLGRFCLSFETTLDKEKTGIIVVTNFFKSLKSGIIGLTQRQLKK